MSMTFLPKGRSWRCATGLLTIVFLGFAALGAALLMTPSMAAADDSVASEAARIAFGPQVAADIMAYTATLPKEK